MNLAKVPHGDLATVNMKAHQIFVNVGACDDGKTKMEDETITRIRVPAFINTRKLFSGDILRVRLATRETQAFTSEMPIQTVQQPPAKKGRGRGKGKGTKGK